MLRSSACPLRVLRRQHGALGVRYAVFAGAVAALFVLAASLTGEQLSLAISERLCEATSGCTSVPEQAVRQDAPDARPAVTTVSSPRPSAKVPEAP